MDIDFGAIMDVLFRGPNFHTVRVVAMTIKDDIPFTAILKRIYSHEILTFIAINSILCVPK